MEINFESNKAARALFDKDLDPIRILRDISIITDKEIIPGRNSRGSEAEVDYIIQNGREIIPVEVKSGKGSTLKSMQLFLKNHQDSPYGIRFSTNNYSVHEKIHSIWRWFGLSFSNKVSDARGNPFSNGFSLAELSKNLKKERFL